MDRFLKPEIVDVISQYVELKRVGVNYSGYCPFHEETKPSFFVSPEKQIFKCFGCDKGGDVYTFIMEYHGVSFREALQILGQEDLGTPSFKRKLVKKVKKIIPHQEWSEEHTKILEAAVKFFVENRSTDMYLYLTRRGITDTDLIEKISVGFAVRGLRNHLKHKNLDIQKAVEMGLLKEKEGYIVDGFINRIIFPVFDIHCRVRSITSRAINDDSPIKHKHLKGPMNHLYGEHLLPQFKDYVVVVEGVFDCLSLLQAGINAVAVYGTGGLNEAKAATLKKFVKNVYIAFDQDHNLAGQKGSIRAHETLRRAGFRGHIFFIELPHSNGKKLDINDLFANEGFTRTDFEYLMLEAERRCQS